MIIRKQIKWEMGHALSAPYQGPCNRLHGHSWTVEFAYEGEPDDRGMVIDFAEFRKMKSWIDENMDHRFYLQHGHLGLEAYLDLEGEDYTDEIETLGIVPVDFNPTSENLAILLHRIACAVMSLQPPKLSVTIWETCTSSATFKGREL